VSIAESGDLGDLTWIVSSYSNGAGGECVECALVDRSILVRDSKCGTGPVVTLGSGAWRAFLGSVLEHRRLAR
jgi:hypothetical protein